MAVFVVLWPYLLTTELSCLQKKKSLGTLKAVVVKVRQMTSKATLCHEHCTFPDGLGLVS